MMLRRIVGRAEARSTMITEAVAIARTWPAPPIGGARLIPAWGLALAMLIAVLVCAGPAPAVAQGPWQDGAYAEFEEALAPHGEWIEHQRYGQVWSPYASEDRSWRPYSRGQWVYTEEHGWYWESEEEFGWATYHYGRWALDERYGWIWVPGTEWGPAWVAWRQGEDEVGWAPLPPDALFDPYEDGATFAVYDQPSYAPLWIFVPAAAILAPRIWRHAFPPARNRFYFGSTRHVTHYARRNRHVFNRGIDPRFVEGRINRPVPITRIRPIESPRGLVGRGDGRSVGIYRPRFPPAGTGQRPGGWRPDERRWAPPREARSTPPDGIGMPRGERGFGRPSAPAHGDSGRSDWNRDGRYESPRGSPSMRHGGDRGFANRPSGPPAGAAPPAGGMFGGAGQRPMQRPAPPPPSARMAPPVHRAAPPQVQRFTPPPRQAPPQVQRPSGNPGRAHGGGQPNRGQNHPAGQGR
jgi:hypothetical protein